MPRFSLATLCLALGTSSLLAVTLKQLSMDDMAVQSTAIVRGHVNGSYAAISGQTVYTHYRVTVAESLKGVAGSVVDVAIPGGTASGVRQTYPGIPQLTVGSDYVLYLWTSGASGLTMPTGFSQGIFEATGDPASPQLSRPANSDLMLDAGGHPVQDKAITMRMPEMRLRVATALAKAGPVK